MRGAENVSKPTRRLDIIPYSKSCWALSRQIWKRPRRVTLSYNAKNLAPWLSEVTRAEKSHFVLVISDKHFVLAISGKAVSVLSFRTNSSFLPFRAEPFRSCHFGQAALMPLRAEPFQSCRVVRFRAVWVIELTAVLVGHWGYCETCEIGCVLSVLFLANW